MSDESPFKLILASAGSGKTHRLTHHLLRQVHDGLVLGGGSQSVVERILAATFTRAAAGEIIDRVLELLARAVLDDKARLALSTHLRGDETLPLDICGAMLQAVVSHLHRMQICTLDSFLIRAAQAFAPELGIAQPWSILDEAADQAVSLEAIDAVLDEHAADTDSTQRMLELLIMMNQGRYPVQIRQRLYDHLRRGYDALLAGPADAWEVICCGDWKAMEAVEYLECVDGLSALLTPHVPLTKAKAPNKRWQSAIKAVCDAASSSNWSDILSTGLIAAMQKSPATYFSEELPDAFIQALTPLHCHCAAQLLARLRERNLSTRELLTHYDLAYRKAKTRRSAWRFEDFTRLLVEAGVTSPEHIDDFYFRLDGEIDHVLLDEFQDTSILQWNMLQPLAEEIISGGEGKHGVERTLLLVGDVKQTLYGWRNAEPRLLDKLKTRWPQLTQESLVKSFRSSQVVIDTVNTVFQSLVGNPALQERGEDAHFPESAGRWANWFEHHITVHTDEPGFCRLSTCSDADDSETLQNNAMRLAAQRVQELLHASSGKEIAILVRRKKFIAQAMNELQKLGVPCSGEGGNPLTDDSAVCAALSLLHLIDHPSDTAALYHVGASPLGEKLHLKTDSDRVAVLKIARGLRTAITDRGLASVLNQWLAEIAGDCDARNFRRFQQLIELAHTYRYDGGELASFLDLVRQKRFEESTAAPVRVMTVHGSKGRQFDYVVLPDLDSAFLMGGEAGILLDRPEVLEPAACISYGPDKLLRGLNAQLAQMDRASKTRQVTEELCSVYVALTRAKTGLEMIVHPQAPTSSGALNLPRSAAGVLRGVLAPGPALPDAELWVQEGSLFPTGTSGALISTTTVSLEKDIPVMNVVVAPPPKGQSRNRPMVSRSSMEGGNRISLAGALSFDNSVSMDRGTALHRLFEQIEWLDDPAQPRGKLRQAIADLGMPPATVIELLAEFEAACKKTNIQRQLNRKAAGQRLGSAASLEVWREREFVVPMDVGGEMLLIRGQLDRVVVARVNGKAVAAEIVEYKTDRLGADGGALKSRASHYRPQLRAYRKAVGKLLGIEESAVACWLIFTEIDRAVNAGD